MTAAGAACRTTWTTATTSTDKVVDVIQDVANDVHQHSYAEEWSCDETKHWHECTLGDGAWDTKSDHRFDWTTIVYDDCVSEGVATGVCTVCGYETTKTLPARGHSFGSWTTLTPATEEEEGEKIRTCSFCGQAETAAIPVLGTLTPLDPEEYYAYQYLLSLGEEGEPLLYAYRKMIAAAEALDTEIDLTDGGYTITKDQLNVAYDCYRCDYPQHFWVDDHFYYSFFDGREDEMASVTLAYTVSAEDLPAMIAAVEARRDELLDGISAFDGEIEIEIAIHDRLVLANTYDTSYSAPETHNLYGSMVNGRSVCDGYAEAFQYLLACAGISSFTVSGEAGGENHAWNVVLLEGEYYFVDVTWDDPVMADPDPDNISYVYLNVTTDVISLDHDQDPGLVYPVPTCTATDAQYFIYRGYTAESLTVEDFARVLNTQKDDGFTESFFLYITAGGMSNAAISAFLGVRENNIAFYDAIEEILGYGDPSVSYSTDSSGHVVSFTITE